MTMGMGTWATRAVATAIVAADGTGDFTTIQEAIDSLPATGGVVYVKEGTYSTAVAIDINRDNVSLFGSGRATIVQRTTAGNIFEAVGRTGTLIAELFADGNAVATNGIYFTGGQQDKISRCWIEDCTNSGVLFDGVNYCMIDGNFFENNTLFGISLDNNSVSNLISSNTITCAGAAAIGISLVDESNYNTLTSNILFGVPMAPSSAGLYFEDGSNNIVSSNYTRDFTSGIIFFNAGCNNNIVTSNTTDTGITDNGGDNDIAHNMA